VGEFSFILGTVARNLGLIDETGWNALIAASIISIALNPSIYRWARHASTPTLELSTAATQKAAIDANRCILVGYGPVGRIVHRLLTERGAVVTVIDLNLGTVRNLRSDGVRAI
jgi:CPA2 family monovalent cation:H+ antiporter-2